MKKQVGDRLVEYGQMQVVTIPAENLNLVFQPGETISFLKIMFLRFDTQIFSQVIMQRLKKV